MTCRTLIQLAGVLIAPVAACSGDRPAGPDPLAACASRATQITLAVGAYISIDPASDSGCVTFPANAAADSAEYLVVPQSVADTGEAAPFQLRGAALGAPTALAALALPPPAQGSSVATVFDGFLRSLARRRGYTVPAVHGRSPAPTAAAGAVAASPPGLGTVRTFTVCDTLDCHSFKNVGARVKAVGAHIAIYVDTLAPAAGLDSADLDTLKQEFDSRLYPLDTAAFGSVSDIDSNTVVIVLMTGVVNQLVTRSRCASAGYVAGFFFSADLDPAFASQFNHGEIFYSIVADSTGTLSCAHTATEVKQHTPSTFTHEFQHMINLVQHELVRNAQPEVGWLDEGLSKYAEELAGRSYLPGDRAGFTRYALDPVYDAYQYLSATGSYPLEIPEDNGTIGEIGASWLFTRYIVDQFGDSLPHRLVNSGSSGRANVAAQTGQPFDTTLAHWALANWVSDLPGFTAPPQLQYTSWHFRTTYQSLNGQDPADFPRPFPLVPGASGGDAVSLSGVLRSGSGVYQRALQRGGAAGFALIFTGSGGAPLPPAVAPRLTIIRIR